MDTWFLIGVGVVGFCAGLIVGGGRLGSQPQPDTVYKVQLVDVPRPQQSSGCLRWAVFTVLSLIAWRLLGV